MIAGRKDYRSLRHGWWGYTSRVALPLFPMVMTLGLAACGTLPSSGPTTAELISTAQRDTPRIRIVTLNRANAAEIAPAMLSAPRIADIGGTTPAPVDLIRRGDILDITLFEVGAPLFGPAAQSDAASGVISSTTPPTANAQTLPSIQVDASGNITLPYIGALEAAGRTPAQLEDLVVAQLRGKSQNPQAVISVRADTGNTVIVMGDVKSPGRRPLSLSRERLLDIIALSGGPTQSNYDTVIRFMRGTATVEEPLDEILSGSQDDVLLAPGDRIELRYRPRSFTLFGASGRVSEIPFQNAHVTLADALARGGGPSDAQADATGIFLFRLPKHADSTETVYRLDLRDPQSYFIAQNFQIENNDIIYIANATTNRVQKFLQIINGVIAPAVVGKQLSQ